MDFLFADALGTPIWLWVCFLSFVGVLLALDLGVFYRKAHVIRVKESLRLSAFYITLGLSFSLFMLYWRGKEAAFLYLTGYVVEQSLSMDNIFVIAVILNYFAIPRQYQHRVLFYGILGVIVLRGVMIGAGSALINEFEWILYVFAIFLVFTGIKMLRESGEIYDVASNPVLKFIRKYVPVTDSLRENHFVVREKDAKSGKFRLFATPLLVALCVIEVADVIFAVDSIPAIFALTTDPFIIFTSNIFAILGLRALFFALSALIHHFEYLRYSLSLVLIFIGGKILIADLFGLEHIPPGWSLSVTLSILAAGVLYSIWKSSRNNRGSAILTEGTGTGSPNALSSGVPDSTSRD